MALVARCLVVCWLGSGGRVRGRPYQACTPGDSVWPVMITGNIPMYWKSANLTSISYPTFYPNIIRLRPTRFGYDPPEIPVCQGILRYDPTPGHPLIGLEQNPAYGTAQTHSNLQDTRPLRPGDDPQELRPRPRGHGRRGRRYRAMDEFF